MHLFFNDPRAAYVTRHRRIVRHPLMALVAGGVGVAALGVAIGAAGWEPPQETTVPDRQAQQLGVVLPEPVIDVNMYGVPAAPQPVLDLGAPPRTLAAPAKPQRPAAARRAAQAKRVEKAQARPVQTPPQTTEPAPTLEPTPTPTPTTTQPTTQPTQMPTQMPTETPTETPAAEPGGGPAWGWWQRMTQDGRHARGHDRAARWS
jgi:hypothetical protein